MQRAALVRVLRILGALALLTTVPSGLIAWSDQGRTIGVFVFAAHVYVGIFCLWGLPWVLNRQTEHDSTM